MQMKKVASKHNLSVKSSMPFRKPPTQLSLLTSAVNKLNETLADQKSTQERLHSRLFGDPSVQSKGFFQQMAEEQKTTADILAGQQKTIVTLNAGLDAVTRFKQEQECINIAQEHKNEFYGKTSKLVEEAKLVTAWGWKGVTVSISAVTACSGIIIYVIKHTLNQ